MVVIREASLADLEGLREVWRNDGQRHKRDLISYPISEWIIMRKDVFLVADTGIKPVGFILARTKGDEAKIDFLSIKKSVRGKGIEKQLLDALEEQLGSSKVTAHIPKDDDAAVQLFKKNGYAVQNEIANLFGPSRDGVVFFRDLSEPIRKPRKPAKKEKNQVKEAEGNKILGKAVYKNTKWSDNLQQLEHASDDEMAEQLASE